MKVKTVTFQKSQTVQVQNFEPCNFLIAATAEVDGDEKQVLEHLKKFVNEEIEIEETIVRKQSAVIREAAKKVIAKMKK